jgi:hypothetical protein
MNTVKLATLRNAVTSQGGDWTTNKVRSTLGNWATRDRATEMLDRLVVEGFLTRHDQVWTAVGGMW